jgi:hypothetical protein
MVVKLNSYTLSDNSIDTMTSALGRSRHINREIGITMCLRRDDIIVLRGYHVGEKRSAPIMRKCNEEEEYIGHYHTHPIATSKATGIDLAKCGNSKITCVGGKSEQTLQQGKTIDNANCYIWKDKVISVQESEQILIDALKGRKEPRNPEHMQHFNCSNTIGRYAYKELELTNEHESLTFAPMRKLSIKKELGELEILVDKEVDKYYNKIDIELRRD